MGRVQIFIVLTWAYNPEKKRIVVKVMETFSNRADAVQYVRINKIPGDNSTKWEVHSSIVELTNKFDFARDIKPNMN